MLGFNGLKSFHSQKKKDCVTSYSIIIKILQNVDAKKEFLIAPDNR